MKKIKNTFPVRCAAVLLTVILGIAAVAGILVTSMTLRLGLYQSTPDIVFSQKAREMQAFYSKQIFKKINNISILENTKSITKSKNSVYAQLNNYPNINNFEYGVIRTDTLNDSKLSSEASYIYQNFEDTYPDKNSLCLAFVEHDDYSEESAPPSLWESLTVTFMRDNQTVTGQKSGSVYWIISNVKAPLDFYSSDIFTKQWTVLSNLYKHRYTSLSLSIFFTVLFLLSAGFCCYNAGKRIDADISHITWRHKTPLILNLCFNLGITGICLADTFQFLHTVLHTDFSFDAVAISRMIFPTAAGILATLFLLMNLTIRYHAGILWKHTLMRTIYNIFSQLYRDYTSLLVKGIIVIAAISVLELLANHYLLGDYESLYIFWFIYKLIKIPLIFAVLLQMKRLQEGSRKLAGGELENKIDTNHMFLEFRKHGKYLNQIQEGMSIALEERMKSEHFKTELITNVSHDIKTPLTSIINYVDLLQKEGIAEEERNEYLSVLERQSARLKKLIENLIDASKASTGNLVINMESCNIQILLTQTTGEFEEKFHASQLDLVIRQPDAPVTILADNRYLWRIFDNLMNNICKYAQPGTRVYIDLETDDTTAHIIFRNISRYPLNFSGEELLERFVRGDVSRNTEGNGLGLSIARSLAESMKGSLDIYTDGDLFKVAMSFALKRD